MSEDTLLTFSSLVDVALFRVSKLIQEEAREAFFGVNRIRLSDMNDKLRYLHELRDVELTGDIVFSLWDRIRGFGDSSDINTFVTLPRLRSLTIGYDALFSRQDPENGLRSYLVGQFGE